MLYMGTTGLRGGRRADDLTARAQIRDAAIECFARSGFRASFREIAARAGVSPALITHHFGSKAALRGECDSEVLDRYRATETGALALLPAGFTELTRTVPHDEAVMVVYILRVVAAGGRAADVFMDRLTEQVAGVLAEYERAGLVRPSRDGAARARFYGRQMLGSVLVLFLTTAWTTPEEFVSVLLESDGGFLLPMLELYSEGLLTSTAFLDQYLEEAGDPPRASSPSQGAP
jgi:AcrR family transcriptional regulator